MWIVSSLLYSYHK